MTSGTASCFTLPGRCFLLQLLWLFLSQHLLMQEVFCKSNTTTDLQPILHQSSPPNSLLPSSPVEEEGDGGNNPDALPRSARLKDLSAGLLSGLLTHADLLDPRCALIVLTADDDLLAGELNQMLRAVRPTTSVSVMQLQLPRGGAVEANTSSPLDLYTSALQRAREVRKNSWCSGVLFLPPSTGDYLASNVSFLASFGEASLANRLLEWSSRLFVLTEGLIENQISVLMRSSWTYSMMNTVLVNRVGGETGARWNVWHHEPYPKPTKSNKSSPTDVFTSSPFALGKVRVVASWSQAIGFQVTAALSLFPEKFNDFYGAAVNVTALSFPPYWIDTRGLERVEVPSFKGTDYELLRALARVLNFKIRVIHTADWGQVTQLVEDRVSFAATIIYAVFPQRLLSYDFTMVFEHAFLTFTMAKPGLRPRWQSLYYPLSNKVWLAVLATLLLTPAFFLLLVRAQAGHASQLVQISTFGVEGHATFENKFRSATFLRGLQELLALLLGQSQGMEFYQSYSSQLMVCSWMIFGFIASTVYRSNLTACLTYPFYPARPETLSQLVQSGARVTMPPYGVTFRDYFLASSSSDFRTLGERFSFVNSVEEGIKRELQTKSAHIEPKRYQELVIAEQFTEVDGSSRIYIAQDSVTSGLSAWPLPHDAPYKRSFDKWIQAVLEAGLYEKWSRELIAEAQSESRHRLQQEREGRAENDDGGGDPSSTEASIEPLSLDHLQGPLYILVLGCAVGLLVFLVELSVFWGKKFRDKRHE